MSLKITILGSGTSTGIPMIGCSCVVCTSKNPKDSRLRTSFLIETSQGKKILIDATPDLRAQLLKNNVTDIDALIITHDHADHTHGIDDLRPLCFKHNKVIPVYTYKECAEALTIKFPYIFQKGYFSKERPILGGGVPRLELHQVTFPITNIASADIEFFLLPHGHTKTLGMVIENVAIIIDCQSIPSHVVKTLQTHKLDTLIIDCVNNGTHKTHLTTQTAFEYIRKIKAKQSGLIHMGHKLGHEQLEDIAMHDISDHDIFVTYDNLIIKA